ncbi:hypothetical protein BST36_12535 [Mycolicibacterium moriokaense]|jgi:L-asparaginase|uniref:L-asparaginase n=1 Tax=Mycolicibacterium moriokaense TaxID=39691 RepID=A0AAD1H933_9MYCO|nr:asparaginase domain-containing protein [Mycolicibacterium moriokaense]MCV7042643.1 asparaginase [Mycolicibacterium moriokaense]ORB23444.1 hypothetical protein BST36_12535 [Mycolicibacterium moriokaense]BBX01192.1 L-asparaginase [Mycolicibacterium moriokaense]
MTLHLVGLGGTISMHDTDRGAVPSADASEIAARTGGFATAESLEVLGGSEVDFPHLERLVAAVTRLIDTGAHGVVVTTGTDSIEEVSAWLSYREQWPIPVVVTGSMVAGARSDSDGAANLADAQAVADGITVDPVVVFAGRIFSGREVIKTSGVERDAFGAPGRGALGIVNSGEVRWHRVPERRKAHGAPIHPIRPVPIVATGLGDDGALLAAAGERHPAVVVAANGAGNLPPRSAEIAIELVANGVLVVVTTRAPDARVGARYAYPGGGATLVEGGVLLASGLSPHRARLLVTLGLAQGRDLNGLRALVNSEAEQP